MTDWRPTATLASLQQRAVLLKKIRGFFEAREVLEVDTPLLSATTNPDPHIESFVVSPSDNGLEKPYYLQTSPEFHMKRLLAAGTGDIYQIAKAFRREEVGTRHNPEFTMLEWYRLGFTDRDLMQEISDLLEEVLGFPKTKFLSYEAMFKEQLDIDIFELGVHELQQVAAEAGIEVSSPELLIHVDDWRNLLMHHVIEPTLGVGQPVIVYDYPASQAALAKVVCHAPHKAHRFELFIDGIELANGFYELTDPVEQRQRFEKDLQTRQREGQPTYPMDERFLMALTHGLPKCAGVALGIERLLMAAEPSSQIGESMSFDFNSA